MVSETPETGYGRRYQRTAEIESRYAHGMDLRERYEKEVDFVMRCADMEFDKDDKVLDLACGIGGHSRLMVERLGVHVDARDFEQDAIDVGRRELEKVTESVRERLDLAVGDMGNILEKVQEGSRYKMITILGSSFMYLGTKEVHQKALNDYFDLLEPGGKLIFQFRQRKGDFDLKKQEEWQRKLKVKGFLTKASGKHGQFGEFARLDEEVHVLQDEDKGDGFYFYDVAVANTEGLNYKEARPEQRLAKGCYDSDDVCHSAFGRAYFDENGVEEKIGQVQIIDYMSENGYHKALKAMLEKAGFQNVHLEMEPLAPDNSFWQFAVVAEKNDVQ